MIKIADLGPGISVHAGRDNSIDKCRRNGWKVGTRLVGDEGYGPTVIEITAIGESTLLAKTISHNGVDERNPRESTWTLEFREWREVPSAGSER